jgi:hypothetical protein
MPVYIVCHKKRNNPRVDVRICELKCQVKEDCREFASQRSAPADKGGADPEAGPVRLEAA